MLARTKEAGKGMEFRVLGAVEVIDGDTTLPLGGPKPRALLAHLLSEAGHAVARERLVDELWGDDPPATVQDSLNVHLAGLRRVLGPRLRTESNGYRVVAEPAEIDAARFEAQVAAARERATDPASVATLLETALKLWRGPVFGGIPVGSTAAATAARLEELRLSAIEDRVDADLACGRHAAMISELSGLAVAHPTRERLNGQLMLALHRSGRSADALVVYESICRALDEHLGVDPGDALTALSNAIRRDDPTLAAPGPGSLPVSASTFVGRSVELGEAGALLSSGRLLTLTGPGGSGKTRLALELARAAAPMYPDGVHLIDLAVVSAGVSMTREVATGLGLRERGDQPLTELLATWARHRRCLLVLDNCDRVVAECARLCTLLLEAAPGLRVLATSRESLGMPGEAVYSVPGLHLPRGDEGDENITASDAVRLFIDRAGAARADFALGSGDAAVLAALSRRLDGLPLAIELAAARLGGMTLQELSGWLEQRIDALGGSRAVHARHRTMRTAIEWSYDLLDAPERAALRRLSVFAGGFTADAAHAVVHGWGPVAADDDTLDLCQRLAGKSMVLAQPGGERTRYRMLEVVRQFAHGCLVEAGEEATARARHAQWFHELIPSAQTWAGPEQRAWIARLQWEVANVRSALGWYLGDGWEPMRALEMVGRLWWFWYMQGLLGEGRGWFSRVLAAAPTEPSLARGLALRGAAATARIMGDFTEAIELGTGALAVFRELGDDRGVAAALNNLCISAMSNGDMALARRHGEESLVYATRLGDSAGIANTTNSLGIVARNVGELDDAARLFATARDIYSANDDRRGLAAALSNLAILGQRRGADAVARELATDALQIYADLDFDEGMLDCLGVLAALDAGGGHAARALQVLAVINRRRDELGAPVSFPDEMALSSTAETRARAALGDADADAAMRDAAQLSVADIVAAALGAAVGGREPTARSGVLQ